jgi:Holliday junction DNA helicase RuvA
MIEFLNGRLVEKAPTHCIIECSGVGYFVNLSVNSSSALSNEEKCKLFIHLQIREDAHTLYGFVTLVERAMFRKLIAVSGVGATTARLILSGMTADEVVHSILSEDVAKLQSVKGIGAKSAQRIIIDLKDKLSKEGLDVNISLSSSNTHKEEALSALIALGFVKLSANKVLDKVIKNLPESSTEELIKQALKLL